MAEDKDTIKADVRLTLTRNGKTFTMVLSNVDVSDAGFKRDPVEVPSNSPFIKREPGPFTVVTLILHPEDHPQWIEESPRLTAVKHTPTLAPKTTGTYGVFCVECSSAANDYVLCAALENTFPDEVS